MARKKYQEPPEGVPKGRYQLVAWDVDTTGRRLIDEIFQIAAYAGNFRFSQYVMPYFPLNTRAQRRHKIRTVTISRYRMLKDLKTKKFLKTKTEVSALKDFLVWLQRIKGNADGIILMYHESRKMAPFVLLQAVRRHNLRDKFIEVVKGFANSYSLAENECVEIAKTFSLNALSQAIFDKKENLSNATDRARMCYHLVQYLGRHYIQVNGNGHPMQLIGQYARTVESEEKDLNEFKGYLERQNTLKPVFRRLLETNWQKASRLRRLLVINGVDYDKLECAWEEARRYGLKTLLKKSVRHIRKKDYIALLEILEGYFHPEKTNDQKTTSAPDGSARRKSTFPVRSHLNGLELRAAVKIETLQELYRSFHSCVNIFQ